MYVSVLVLSLIWFTYTFTTPDRRQSKTLILSTNIDQKSLETQFLIAFCRPTGNKWPLKTLFYAILIRVFRLLGAFSFVPIRCVYSSLKVKLSQHALIKKNVRNIFNTDRTDTVNSEIFVRV